MVPKLTKDKLGLEERKPAVTWLALMRRREENGGPKKTLVIVEIVHMKKF